MSDIVIKAENLGKKYTIGHQAERARYTALRDVLMQNARNIWNKTRDLATGKPIIQGDTLEDVWALKDVNFEIRRGETVGIIGRNGAGKSTLLKILSRITEPSAGRVTIKGRVASLLEVGTGFHPELSGRENIYLNGTILGMTRAEIRKKFDEIVAFAEVEKYLDTPVKRYSSGMYVRLAFTVAAHLEPEILVVDEVLAVGDADFQNKCIGKMNQVSQEGRTVLFVSHNMTAIEQLCTKALLINKGSVIRFGCANQVINEYLQTGRQGGEIIWADRSDEVPGNEKLKFHSVRILSNKNVQSTIAIDQEIEIQVDFWNFVRNAKKICINIYLIDNIGNIILSTANVPWANAKEENWFDEEHPTGLYRATCKIPGNFLNNINYQISVFGLTLNPVTIEARADRILTFSVHDTGTMRRPGHGGDWYGVVRVPLAWQTHPLTLDSLGLSYQNTMYFKKLD